MGGREGRDSPQSLRTGGGEVGGGKAETVPEV